MPVEAAVSHPFDHVGDGAPRAAIVIRGMAHRHRMRILVLLRSGELTFSAITDAVPAPRPTIGHHLRQMLDAGLIRRRRRGGHVVYFLSGDAVEHLVDAVMTYAERRARDAPSHQ